LNAIVRQAIETGFGCGRLHEMMMRPLRKAVPFKDGAGFALDQLALNQVQAVQIVNVPCGLSGQVFLRGSPSKVSKSMLRVSVDEEISAMASR
jgi:hypothetical protein